MTFDDQAVSSMEKQQMSAASQSKGVINEVLEVCQVIFSSSHCKNLLDVYRSGSVGALYGTNLYVSQKLSFKLDAINYQLYQNFKRLGNSKI